MDSMYVRFLAPVTPTSTDQLMKIIDKGVADGIKEMHLMISSPGGSVLHGISLYNLLRAVDFKVYTYNFGSVDSIGVVLFCAGGKRYCMPHARFLIHPVQFNLQSMQQYDEKKILEILKGIEIDQLNIVKIISDTIGKPVNEVFMSMSERLTLGPQEALAYGLIDDIKILNIPPKATMFSVHDGSQTQERNMQR